jgi:hypothetical protein
MFINCPYCRALVATDPVTDEAPTHCPHCDSLLRRDPSQPEAEGIEDERPPLDLVELLNTPFDAPAAAPPDTTPASVSIDPDARDVADDGSAATGIDAADPIAADTAAESTTAAVAAPAAIGPRVRVARALPSFVRRQARTPAGPRERWLPVAVAVLALTLVLQLLLADRARLAADARWRPLLHAICGVLRCDLPPWREPTAFTLLQRDVRQHPSRPGALRVTATFRNDARWPQPWPQLTLTLSDANGRTAGERSFRAEDYLGGPPSQPELGSGESAAVAMDILEPAPDIVGYDFGFR